MTKGTSPAANIQTRVAVIVCTRGRPSLANLLQSIQECRPVPAVVIVVDASPGRIPGLTLTEDAGEIPIKFIRVGSDPGLPHQRNVGVEFLLSRDDFRNCDILSFLDDDVEVSSNYFGELARCFDLEEKLITVGAVDDGQKNIQISHVALRLALVTSRRNGKVLSSGFATPPIADAFLSETEWVPGFAVSFRRYLFETYRFDDQISFYGEDLEFQLRISHLGKIAISNRLRVIHRQSPLSRDSIRDHWSYSDGFRWSMVHRFPCRVKRLAVIWSTLCLMLLEAVRFIRKGTSGGPAELLGHCDFFCRLLSFRQVEKIRT